LELFVENAIAGDLVPGADAMAGLRSAGEEVRLSEIWARRGAIVKNNEIQ
jgi:hypothetical protein